LDGMDFGGRGTTAFDLFCQVLGNELLRSGLLNCFLERFLVLLSADCRCLRLDVLERWFCGLSNIGLSRPDASVARRAWGAIGAPFGGVRLLCLSTL